MHYNNHYNKTLQPYARQNRNNMNKAEACLWKYALKAKMTGYTFNRQRPVLNYIADFMCKELKLIIEVDGSSHHSEEAQKKDAIRQQELEAAGFLVIRFTNQEVLKNIIGVKRSIADHLEARRDLSPSLGGGVRRTGEESPNLSCPQDTTGKSPKLRAAKPPPKKPQKTPNLLNQINIPQATNRAQNQTHHLTNPLHA